MIIDRRKHAAFLEEELNAQTEDFKMKLRTSALSLMSRNELFVGLYTKFLPNGEMVMMMPTTRGVPRINEYYYCFLPPSNLRKYKEWGNISYQDLISEELCATDLKCIWHSKSSDPNFVLAGFHQVSLAFKQKLEHNGHKVALILGPKVPPYEYLSNLHQMVVSNTDRFDLLLDSDYLSNKWVPILLDEKSDLIELSASEFKKTDIFTLQGPPGTGKTYRIARLCEHLCSLGKSVLVTALTNQALMSVAEKIEQSALPMQSKVYKTSLSADEKKRCQIVNEIDDATPIKSSLVLATFYKMSHAALSATETSVFDFVIVDEASQAFLATLSAAKRLANKAVFVGDVNQMPPISLLSNAWIEKNGYAPLIEGLSTFVQTGSHKLFQLTVTYRLGSRGASSTGIFYNDSLKSAHSQLFSDTSIDGPIIKTLTLPIGDTMPANAIELAIKIIKNIRNLKNKQIAIITHRIDTVLAIQKAVVKSGIDSNNILVDTVARVQGMTKDVVIYIIPNTDCMIYCLEKRLFNVATSRARENTFIIIDKNYATYQYADPLVLKYLVKAEES